jgi:leucine dehydrogenase
MGDFEMSVFTHPEFDSHEELVFCRDAASGLSAIIAIHNTSRGPSLGGCRIWPYASEEEALSDVLRLSRGMTYKAAMAGLPYGGGKSVIIGNPRKDKSEPLLRAMGRFVHSLGGRYHTAEDVGTTVEDMDVLRLETPYAHGFSSASGDPSPATAYGVYMGIRAAVRFKLG